MIKKKNFVKIFNILVALMVFSASCASENEVPTNFQNIVLAVKKELNAIEEIPINNTYESAGKNSIKGTICFKKRAVYVVKNIENYNKILDDFEILDDAIKQTKWHDDAVFIEAYFRLTISTLKMDNKGISSTIRCITNYLDLSDDCKIEKWTKNEMEKSIWSKLRNYFSDEVSEKMNLNQYFYLARASLFKNHLNDVQKAMEDYKKAIIINPKSFWGQQAQLQIKHLAIQRAL